MRLERKTWPASTNGQQSEVEPIFIGPLQSQRRPLEVVVSEPQDVEALSCLPLYR